MQKVHERLRELRPYQLRDYRALQLARRRSERTLFVAPTGYGKTRMAAEDVRTFAEKGVQCIFLAPWRELIPQTAARFRELGLQNVGVLMAGYEPEPDADVIVASIETIRRWLPRYPQLLDAGYIAVDEAHRIASGARKALLDEWPDAVITGYTATPFRPDRGGLGDVFGAIVLGASMEELIEEGYLVEPIIYGADPKRVEGLQVQGPSRDYSPRALEARMAAWVGDLIEDWETHAKGRKTLCFAASVKHSKQLAKAFVKAGHRAAHLDAATPRAERERLYERLGKGELDVLCNYGVLCEGFDLPAVDCVIVRPTASLRLWLQMVGRGLRAHDNKKNCIVLDPGGNVYRLGRPEAYRHYTLDGVERRDEVEAHRQSAHRTKSLRHNASPRSLEGNVELVELDESDEALLERLHHQATSSGYGAPWVVSEFRRLRQAVPAHLKEDARVYLEAQAAQSRLPDSWVIERMRALFS